VFHRHSASGDSAAAKSLSRAVSRARESPAEYASNALQAR
jgi:hypothetical protein